MKDNDHDDMRSLSNIFGRVFWMMIGPLSLVLLVSAIVQINSGWLTWADFGYLAVLAAMPLARWFEFRRGTPRTADGQPATRSDLRRYVQATLPLGIGVWIVANVFANHVLNR